MTLTNRLTGFGLAALAAALAGFSVALYFLAEHHLNRQTADRLAAAQGVLAAAIEVAPTGVEWEATGRKLATGDGVAWRVTGPGGEVVAAGGGLTPGWPTAAETFAPADAVSVPEKGKFASLTAAVAADPAPARAALRSLLGGLLGVSAAVWVVAMLVGRAACRWALRPVTRMAAAAAEIPADDLAGRLPVPRTGDELEHLGRAFNDLLSRAGRAFDRQRAFAAEASHQLRTPLTAVIGQVEVALRRDRDGAEYRRVLEAVGGQADRLRVIVESLLFLARADADGELPERAVIDLADWLPVHVVARPDRPRAADIVLDAHGPAAAAVHVVLLGELVDELLDNAAKYGPAGTPITVRVARVGGVVEIDVRDCGPGVDEADEGRLFEPFFRSAAARRAGVAGLGLGLAVADRIATAHRGTLALAPGPGGRFVLTLLAATSSP